MVGITAVTVVIAGKAIIGPKSPSRSGARVPLGAAGPGLDCLDLSISGWRSGDQRVEQVHGRVRDLGHRGVERDLTSWKGPPRLGVGRAEVPCPDDDGPKWGPRLPGGKPA
jgi:hypothetical protein